MPLDGCVTAAEHHAGRLTYLAGQVGKLGLPAPGFLGLAATLCCYKRLPKLTM